MAEPQAGRKDELGVLRRYSVESTEATSINVGPPFTRTFTYYPNLAIGRFTRTGPDGPNGTSGTTTMTQTDDAGRLLTYERRASTTNVFESMSVDSYDEANRARVVTYGNGAQSLYDYDDANRLTRIIHRAPIGMTEQREGHP